MSDTLRRPSLLRSTADIVAAHASRSSLTSDGLIQLIETVYNALAGTGGRAPEAAEPTPQPAVRVRESVFPDYIVCLEDGKKLKMLKRHLMTAYNLTPDQYREKWGLPSNYPMVAPGYAAVRSDLAKASGLGRKAAAEVSTPRKTRKKAATR